MLRNTPSLSRGLITWMGQIAASLAATAVASMICASIPKLAPATGPSPVALTSGGKFAARVPGAAEMADGVSLSAEPRRLLLPAITDIAMPSLAASAGGAEWDQTLAPAPALARMPTQPGKAPHTMHADPRHGAELAHADLRRASAPAMAPPSGADPIGGAPKSLANIAGAGALDARTFVQGAGVIVNGAGALMPKLLQSAQSAWTMTASAGTSLLSRLTP